MIRDKPQRMQPSARPGLDHLVLPTADLAVARRRLTSLGFIVAPEGVHPFGTRNACVYFEDGTFLEPLALGDRAIAEAAAAAGNVFVARDGAFRQIVGDEGLSALVLTTRDADRDHQRFVAAGISAGERLDFSRWYRDADGIDREVSFRLAFAARPETSASFVFTCERVNAPSGGRGALAVHANGVTGIARVIATSADPQGDAAMLSRFADTAAESTANGFAITLGSTTVEILDPRAFADSFGITGPDSGGEMRFAAIVFAGAARFASDLEQGRDIAHLRRDGRRIVPPAPGQGAAFIFEEQT
jgi:hypothetical protein